MLFVAEIGLNHNGNFGLAFELIRQSKLAGADIVKFQLGWRGKKGELNYIDEVILQDLIKWSNYFDIELMFSIFTEEAWDLMKVIDEKGGFIECFKQGWIEEQINEARYEWAEAVEKGSLPVVGVNIFRDEEEHTKINIFRQASDMQKKRIEYIKQYKKNRDQGAVDQALDRIHGIVEHSKEINIVESIMAAVESKATLQEICDAMRRAAQFDMPGASAV